jgi:4-hydroxyphenylpyruvate dioxygenase-like putative hemolysin
MSDRIVSNQGAIMSDVALGNQRAAQVYQKGEDIVTSTGVLASDGSGSTVTTAGEVGQAIKALAGAVQESSQAVGRARSNGADAIAGLDRSTSASLG